MGLRGKAGRVCTIVSSFKIKGTQMLRKMRFQTLHTVKVRLYALYVDMAIPTHGISELIWCLSGSPSRSADSKALCDT